MSKPTNSSSGDSNVVTKALLDLVTHIPTSNEPADAHPKEKAQGIARATAVKAAGISAALALPPGPLGFATIIPDLLAIWRLQQAMVADIAAVYGKSRFLQKETMIYCLFKHAGAALMRDLVVRAGGRYLVRGVAVKAIQEILQKIGVRVTQRVIGKSVSRLVPIIGALGVAAYAYYDTTQVAATTIDLFSKELGIDDNKESAAEPDAP